MKLPETGIVSRGWAAAAPRRFDDERNLVHVAVGQDEIVRRVFDEHAAIVQHVARKDVSLEILDGNLNVL